MRIAVYTIALDEEPHVERFLESAADADLVAVTDTGSSDGTVDALRDGGAEVHQVAVRPFRFDVARNASLALLPDDIDVCVSIDLDEVLEPGWRAHLEAGWGRATRGRYRYVYNTRPDGSDGWSYWGDKIHARHGYRWVHPSHEVLVPDRTTESIAWLDLTVRHLRDGGRDRSQYHEQLVLSREESPHDPIPSYYLARYLWAHRRWAEAEPALLTHLDRSDAINRGETLRMLGDACHHLGRPEEALRWWRRAVAEQPDIRETWLSLAEAAADRSDWGACWAAATTALAIEDRPGMSRSPAAWGERPHVLASRAAEQLGLGEQALRHAVMAAEIAPEDPSIAAMVERLTGAG